MASRYTLLALLSILVIIWCGCPGSQDLPLQIGDPHVSIATKGSKEYYETTADALVAKISTDIAGLPAEDIRQLAEFSLNAEENTEMRHKFAVVNGHAEMTIFQFRTTQRDNRVQVNWQALEGTVTVTSQRNIYVKARRRRRRRHCSTVIHPRGISSGEIGEIQKSLLNLIENDPRYLLD